MNFRKREAFGWHSRLGVLYSEKGIALVFVLILSLICLAIVASLIYFVTQGTKFSGFNKRYETAREAAYGGTEVLRALIGKKGQLNPDGLGLLITALNVDSKSVIGLSDFKQQCNCGDTTKPDDITPTPDSCLCRKLCSPTLKTTGSYNWKTCDSTTDPTSGSYDLKFQLDGFGRTYDVFAKIVDTSPGTTDMSGLNLGGTAVTASSGQITLPQPYLYSMEITAQDKDYATNLGLRERGRLSVLYAY